MTLEMMDVVTDFLTDMLHEVYNQFELMPVNHQL